MLQEHWLRRRSKSQGDAVALVVEGRTWTYREVDAAVTARARKIALLPPGRLGYLAANGEELYLWLLAGQYAGRELVLLNWRLSAAELGAQVADAGCVVLLADDDRAALAHDLGAAVAPLTSPPPATEPGPDPHIDLDAVTTIMYTSGTTGQAKGVMQTYGNHWWSAVGSMLNLGLEPSRDAWVCAMPLFHVSGFSILIRGLVYGIPVHLLPRFDAAEVNRLLLSGQATTVSVVTRMLIDLLDDLGERTYPETLRCLLLGGGFVDDATLTRCLAKGLPVVFSFGMTETASQVIALSPADVARKKGSAGLPLMPVSMRIAPTSPMQGDGVGELQLRSPTLTVGYVNQPERYRESFTDDGWFRTGDLGYLDEEGYLYVVARLADMIITGGENVFPAEIENVIGRLDGVRDVAVVGAPDARWGHVPVAFIVADATVGDADVLAACRRSLAAYKVPARVVRLRALPRTSTGKVQRHVLVAAAAQETQLENSQQTDH